MKQSPFKFLSAYAKEDQAFFFGRETEIKNLYELVLQSRLTLLYGASGTGKTSLIRCGLANQFQTHDWKELYIRRKSNLIDSLWAELQKNAITPFTDYNGDGTLSVSEAIESLFLDYFTPIYLIFDQFEELFILGDAQEQSEFIETIAELLNSGQNCHLIFSLREEYLGHLYELEKKIPQLLQSRLRVELMSRENLQKVVSGTVQFVGVGIENTEQTINKILENIGGKKTGSVSLPYLQVYLDKLYRTAYQPEKQVVFTEKLVAETGEIQDVLDDFLANQIKEIDEKWGKNDLSRRLLNEFLTTEGTKRPCEIAELNERCKELLPPAELQNLLLELVNRRILQSEENRYELAHDSLAAAIDRRRTAEERALLEISRMVKEGLTAFQKTGGLMNEENLKYIQNLLPKISLSEAEKDFLAKSKAKVRANRLQRQVAITFLIMLTVFAMGFGIYAFEQKNEADRAKEKAIQNERQAQENLSKFLEEQKNKNKLEAAKLLENAQRDIDAEFWEKATEKLDRASGLDTSDAVRTKIIFLRKQIKK